MLANRVLAAFEPSFDLAAGEARTSPSIGIALCALDREYDDLLHLLTQADHAMYRARAAGKGRYAIYDPVLDRTALGLS